MVCQVIQDDGCSLVIALEIECYMIHINTNFQLQKKSIHLSNTA
jgi:hypothetical protein